MAMGVDEIVHWFAIHRNWLPADTKALPYDWALDHITYCANLNKGQAV